MDQPRWKLKPRRRTHDLDRGTRLGPYESSRRSGQAGWARSIAPGDTRLDRIVAIKSCRSTSPLSRKQGSASSGRRVHFVAEPLQHLPACTTWASRMHSYLVMEYLEGETLADRLRKGPCRWTRSSNRAWRFATGCRWAHRSGVVHRT